VHIWEVNGANVAEIPMTAPGGESVQLKSSTADSSSAADTSSGVLTGAGSLLVQSGQQAAQLGRMAAGQPSGVAAQTALGGARSLADPAAANPTFGAVGTLLPATSNLHQAFMAG
jgi:hypothetical protein